MNQVQVTANGLRNLLRHAREQGTVSEWIDLALEWMDKASDKGISLRAELAKAREVIAKLPKYADTGEAACPGDMGWIVGEGEFGERFPEPTEVTIIHRLAGVWCLTAPHWDDCLYWTGPVTSTREAAEAAREDGDA